MLLSVRNSKNTQDEIAGAVSSCCIFWEESYFIMCKLIVLDLDGTLLRKDKTVSEETINVLLSFKNQNNKILFATARPPRDAYKYVPEVLRDNPIICYNGACIIDKDKKVLYRKEISRENALKVLKTAKKFGYENVCFEINDVLYSTFDTYDFFGDCENQIADLENMEFDTVYKVIICNKIPISKEFLSQISDICKCIITDNGTLCQIMDTEVSKWNSINALIKQESIEDEDIIAFGDDYNDYEMIKNAGIGVAMGNAEESIKQIANYTTSSNTEEGVSKFIKEHLIKK